MKSDTLALERAFQLARSGDFANVNHIKKQLSKEGYATEQLTGPVLLAQIRSLIEAAHPA